jgi:hypothetical protein
MVQIEKLLADITGLNTPVQHQVQLQAAVAVQALPPLSETLRALETLPESILEALANALAAKALPPSTVQDAEIVGENT